MKSFRIQSHAAPWIALAVALAITHITRAESVAAMPAPAAYVDDYAGVLSAPAKSQLDSLCTEIHDKTRAQVFFVTIKTLDGADMDTFANQLFHKWGIGEKKTDRGILLILAIKEHKRRIEVGYGFEGILNDAKAGDIGREMVPALQASNYDEAARIGVDDVATIIASDSNVTFAGLSADASQNAEDAAPPPVRKKIGKPSAPPFLPITIFAVLFFGGFGLFIWLVVWNIRRGVRFGGAGGGPTGSGSSFSSSSDSSSSFDSSSSSSDSFSGGGGGDSGGGGAGGSW